MIVDPMQLIIRKRERGFNRRKAAVAASAIFFWGIFLYLVLAMVGWVAGLFLLESAFDAFKSIVPLERAGEMFVPVVLGIYLSLWTWSAYNRYRFGGKRDRRSVFPPPLSTDAIGRDFDLPKSDIEEIQRAKVVVCRFDRKRALAGAAAFSSVAAAEAHGRDNKTPYADSLEIEFPSS